MADGAQLKVRMLMSRSWSINGRFLSQPLTGVQRYGYEILRALDELIIARHPLTCNLDLEVLAPPGDYKQPKLAGIPIRSVGSAGGHRWEQLTLARESTGGLVSLCNTGPIFFRKHIVCVHDMNTRIVPSSYSRQFRLGYRALLPLLGRSAMAFTTVSQFSAGQIARYRIRRRESIRVIPNGHEHALGWGGQHSKATQPVAGADTILLIGSKAPHKNIPLLLDMAPALKQNGFRLAIVGSGNDRIFAGQHDAMDDGNVTWLGRIDDDELAVLLGSSLCLAFPSLTEGFGLPPLEAMALGCPVVTSDRGSLPEVCGDAALYASPTDPASWLQHFQYLRDHPNARQAMIDRGRKVAARFSWSTSARAYLQIMAELDGISVAADAERQSEIASG